MAHYLYRGNMALLTIGIIIASAAAGFCDNKFISGWYCDSSESKYCSCSFFDDDCDKTREEKCFSGCNAISGRCYNSQFSDTDTLQNFPSFMYLFLLALYHHF